MITLTEEMLNGELTTVWLQLGEIVPPKQFRFSLYNTFNLSKAESGTIFGAEFDEKRGTWDSKSVDLKHLFLTEAEANFNYYSELRDNALSMIAHHQRNINYESAEMRKQEQVLEKANLFLNTNT